MIRKPEGLAGKRLAAGVLVAAASALTLGVGLASSADAAPANAISLVSPHVTGGSGDCVTVQAKVVDASGAPVVGDTVTINISGTGADLCTAGVPDPAPAVTTGTDTTDASGIASFEVSGTAAVGTTNTINIAVSDGPAISNTGTLVVSSTTEDTVSKLVANPATGQQVVSGGTATYTVTATDQFGNPVGGVVVNSTNPAYSGGSATTNANGVATFTAAGVTSTENTTFFVNYDTPGNTASKDSNEPSTDVSTTLTIPQAATSLTLTCPDQLATGGGAKLACTVPTGTSSVTFTATVYNTVGTNTTVPVANQVVHFSTSGAGTLSTPTASTNASGQITVTYTPTAAEASTGGTAVNVTASTKAASGATFTQVGTVTFAAPAVTTIKLNPGSESVTKGGNVNETATVLDQFGKPITTPQTLQYSTSGGSRNAVSGSFLSGTNGQGVFSYTDTAPSTSVLTQDVLTVHDAALATTNATITYINGSTTPAATTLNYDNNGANNSCLTNTTDPANTIGGTSTVCVVVKNSSGEALAGVPVVFTVDKGFVVGGQATLPATVYAGTNTVTVSSDNTGIAFATVGSNVTGAQTISATVGGTAATNTLTDTYGGASKPITDVTITPSPATISAGQSQKFTATAKDANGNGVPGAFLTFSQSGAGSLSLVQAITAADGTASVTVDTGSSENGAGTVSAQAAPGAGNGFCDATVAGNVCAATATYTVKAAVLASKITLSSGGATFGGTLSVEAHVTNSDGSAGASVPVEFSASGAFSASATGSTGPNGNVIVKFPAKAAGSEKIVAYVDTNENGVHNTGEPSTSLTKSIAKRVEKPTIHTQSRTKGWIHVTVATHPATGNRTVWIYSVSANGTRTHVATAKAGPGGVAAHTFKGLKSGSSHRYTAKVVLGSNYTSEFAAGHTQRVK